MNDGGPVFPVSQFKLLDDNPIGGGMSIRDYFAAKAMQGAIVFAMGDMEVYKNLPFRSYELADAMLTERNKNLVQSIKFEHGLAQKHIKPEVSK